MAHPPTKAPPRSDATAHPSTKAHPSSCPESSGRTSSAVSCDVSPTYTTTVLNGDWLNVDSVTEGPQDTLRSVCSARQRAIHPGPGGFLLQLPHQPHTVFATTHSIPRTCQAWAEGEPMPPPRDLEAQLPPARGETTSPSRPPATGAARLVGRREGGHRLCLLNGHSWKLLCRPVREQPVPTETPTSRLLPVPTKRCWLAY